MRLEEVRALPARVPDRDILRDVRAGGAVAMAEQKIGDREQKNSFHFPASS